MERRESKKYCRGFSLVEVLVATFIFTIVAMGVTGYFGSIVRANQNSKRLQQNLEDARFAMDRMAKVFRTSVIISSTASTLRVFDYSQKKCIEYAFWEAGIRERISSPWNGTVNPQEKSWCAGLSNFASSESILLSSGGATIAGTFTSYPSSKTAGSERAGRVIMSARIVRQNISSTLQTTVSLRNFDEVYP